MGSTPKRSLCCIFSTSGGEEIEMSMHDTDGPLQPGDRAPNVVLDAITRDGKVAIDDFRGQPVLVGLFRGLHCPSAGAISRPSRNLTRRSASWASKP